MPSNETIIRNAFYAGHFWNEANPDCHGVTPDALGKLKLSDSVVKKAVQSWQRADRNLDIAVQRIHGRKANYDGDVGPATRKLASLERCPVPDHAPPEGVDLSFYEDESLRDVVETMRANASGTGSWPQGCVTGHEDVHCIRINLNTSQTPTVVREYLDRALLAVREAYADIGLRILYVVDGEPLLAEIEKRWVPLAGTVIGWNEFPTPNVCGQTISGRLDTNHAPSDWLRFANLEQHETGHGVGLRHTNGGVMNPTILRTDLDWRTDPSFDVLKGLFGGEPISVDAGGPAPAPSGGVVTIRIESAEFTASPGSTIVITPEAD